MSNQISANRGGNLETGNLEIAIGVFSSRDRAQEAVKQLKQQGIPEAAIVFLTRSEDEARAAAKSLARTVGNLAQGAADASVAIADFLLPGIGTVFALGFGGVTFLRMAGIRAALALGLEVGEEGKLREPVAGEKCEEAALLREVLKRGRSLVVVRTESRESVTSACAILDRSGLTLQEQIPVKFQTTTRQVGETVVIGISGRITVGEGNVALREKVRNLVDSGKKHIILNLEQVSYVDSSGLGELVRIHTTIRSREGELKLVNLSKQVDELLQITKLLSVFDIHKDEASAINSFGGQSSKQAIA